MKNLFALFLGLLITTFSIAQTGIDSIIIGRISSEVYDATVTSVLPTQKDTVGPDILAARWTSGGVGHNWRSYLKFDLSGIPSNATVVSATISFYADSISGYGYFGTPTYGTANASYLQRVTTPWSRTTISWNNQPSVTASNAVTLPQSTSTKQNYINMNITNMVLDWMANGNHGFLLRHVQESTHYNSMIFWSPRAVDTNKRPILKVFYSLDTEVYISQPIAKATYCAGDTIHLKYKVTKPFNPNNTFVAQLSNTIGGFANPVNIGSVSSVTDGTIICTIPSSLPSAVFYRIRIVASNKPDTSYDNGSDIIITQSPDITSITGNFPVCEGDTLKLTTNMATAGFNYSWTGPSGFFANTKDLVIANASAGMSGTYRLIAEANNCMDSVYMPVTVNSKPLITINTNSPVCWNDSTYVLVSTSPSSATCTWTGPGGFTSGSKFFSIPTTTYADTGNYIVTAVSNGCTSQNSIIVKINTTSVDLGTDTTLCAGSELKLMINTATDSIIWQDGTKDNKYNVSKAGKYYVTSYLGNCVASDTINVRVIRIYVNLGNDTNLCLGQEITLSVTDTFDIYDWSTLDTVTSIVIKEGGSYGLSVGKFGCYTTDTIQISYYEQDINLGSDTVICRGEKLILDASSNIPNSTYKWQDGKSGASYLIEESGVYWVQVTNQCGTVLEQITVGVNACDCNPFVPTGFTPDGNGKNDKVGPHINCTSTDYEFMIVNRWGQIVFKSNTSGEEWDGTVSGIPADAGTYYYYFRLTSPRSKDYNMKGSIVLIR